MKLIKALFSCALISLPVAAENAHIADNAPVFFHSGPSSQFRISGSVRSGESVTILAKDSKTNYVQIKTPSGRTGWMSNSLVATGPSKLTLLPNLTQQLEEASTLAKQRQMSISQLREDLTKVKVERDDLADQLLALKDENTRLSNSMKNLDSSNLMRWFTYGGLVAFGGVILGLIFGSLGRRPKRQSTW